MTVCKDNITHYCYRLRAEVNYDPEDVWQYIQDYDGYLSLGVAGEVYFWIDRSQHCFFVLKYPLLEPVPERDML